MRRTGQRRKQLRRVEATLAVVALLAGLLAAIIPAGAAVGGPTCSVPTDYATIQAAINDAGCTTIEVAPGTYVENLTINRNLTLVSTGGRGATTIQGVSGAGALGAIKVTGGTTGVQIGAAGQGFTILGIDNGSPGLENAAVYFQGSNSGAKVIDNEIVAMGDHGLLTEYGATISGFVIDSNEFSGQTFLGANPAGVGFGTQFSQPNVPRQLVTMGGGSGGGNTSNVTFINNLVSGTAGGISSDDFTSEQGNTLVTLDSNGVVVAGNVFAGTTARYGTALRIRGANSVVTGNVFDPSGMGGATGHIYTQYRSGVSITDNRFDNAGTALPYAIGADGGTGAAIFAECNWYGSASGPAPSGSGAAVSPNIDFSPWRVAPAGSCLGGTLMGDKYGAIDALAAALPTGDKKTDDRFEKAIESIEDSLDPALWIDSSTLDPKHGNKVFDEEKKAVKELSKVGSALAQSVIDTLVAVDADLAQGAMDDAQAAIDDLVTMSLDTEKAQKELDKATEAMAKAADQLAEGDYDKAIDQYKKAWEHAQKAIEKAEKEMAG